ncbi:hypothetical protein AJ79_04439 [Helicocarpus griseus UAMH5409]|uniref:FAD/NAD(P)-binding domain-containing protein n=1 Tax=Helicocarpus griseus UAMH5409 TaxID=1447875 RepID=A0A2B7XT73_9EURO|nr:hypothetical protein AJ79_04439 [Helicocarpus griseus UAMH5409]
MAPYAGTDGVLYTLPGSLPQSTVPDGLNPETAAIPCIARLNFLTTADFTEGALWKDLYALTGLPRTLFSARTIGAAWKDVYAVHKPWNFAFTPGTAEVVRMRPDSSWVEARFTFETKGCPAAFCSGMLSLVQDGSGVWKIWILRTILERLKGHPDVDVPNPRVQTINMRNNEFDCLVVGAGQCGLATAGRLQSLDVNYLLIEKNENIGDNWMLRYDSVKLHTVRAFAHLPFERTFPAESYPELLSRHDLAKGYKLWCDKLGINVWLSSQLKSGSRDEKKKKWNLVIRRKDGETRVSARHLVLSTGATGQDAAVPAFPGREKFKGLVLHSSEYKSASQWKGKSGVVVGSANTAHDICDDMVEAGLSSITMVQRSRTYILPVEFAHVGDKLLLAKCLLEKYNDAISTDLADRIEYTTPLSIASQIATMHLNAMVRQNPERFDALERVGFKVQRYGNPIFTIYENGGKHYIDVGTSAKIAKGLIKVKSDSLIAGYTKNGLIFEDGSEVKADVIVLATGYETSFRPTVVRILGANIAAQVEDFWGLDREGEVVGGYKPIGHPALWYMGGPLGHSRFFSRFVSLQIKAELSGTPLIRYSRTPSNDSGVIGNAGIGESHL